MAGAGELRARVELARPNTVQDEYGNVTSGFQPMFQTFAQITPRLGGEQVIGARLAGRQPVNIRLRQTPDTRAIRTDWKATNLQTGTEYNIRTAVDPHEGDVEHGKWIDLLAEAGVEV